MDVTNDPRDPQTHAIIGAAMEVHKNLGSGFLEAVYQEALALELTDRSIPYSRERPLSIRYRRWTLTCNYRADFICYDSVLVELKAISRITHIETAQVLNYLKATGLKRDLLINFGSSSLEFERIVLNLDS